MRGGKLRDPVSIERPGSGLDDYGQTSGWEVVSAKEYAEIMPISGSERLRANAIESTLSTRIRVRYHDSLMPPMTADAWRIKFGTRIFNIVASLPDAKKTQIVFDCTEGSADGQ